MTHQVLLTENASPDLVEIVEYIAAHDSPARAQYVLDRIEAVLQGLTSLPEGGAHPGELLALGVREYREVFFKPYRVVYRAVGERV
jgi:toxin ParE1/3/4